jgi:addiction module HigA family antidote
MREVPYPHPGEILQEEFLKPLGVTNYRLAKAISVPAPRIGEIVAGKRSVTADTGLRLARFFGMTDWFFVDLQADYDRAMALDLMAEKLDAIVPWAELSKSLAGKPSAGRTAAPSAKRGPRV